MAIDIPFTFSQEFFIPFLFTLAVVFGIMQISNVFKGNRAVSVIISLAIAAFAATYQPFLSLLNQYLPSIVWFFIVMFFIAFSLELFGIRKGSGETRTESMVIGGGVLLILLVVGFSLVEAFDVEIPYIGSGDNLIFLIGIIIIFSLFWAAMKMKNPEPPKG